MVLVPFFNNKPTLIKCVTSILQCQPPADQIVFVDDGSTDGGSKSLKNLPITLLKTEHNGRAAALNAGLAKSNGDIVFFTDADCVVPTDWISKHLEMYEKMQLEGVGGNLLPSQITIIETAKVLRYIHEFEKDRHLKVNYQGVCLNGNNMSFRTKALKKVGGFDESYIHGADADLTKRLLKEGYQLYRSTKITTTHLKVDSFFSFLKTSFLRGSTIRFNQEGHFGIFRSLLMSPLKNFAIDTKNISRLKVFDAERSWIIIGFLASIANLFSAWINTAGKIYFRHRFNSQRG